MIQFSIIVCTYNPNKNNLMRLLNALSKFSDNEIYFEILLVDNKSTYNIGLIDFVQKFVSNKSNNALVLIEENLGLTSARLRGISESKYDWLIFFDDDNEPASDYLVRVVKAIEQYPPAVWGPGIIKVEYIDESNNWLEKHKEVFQERNEVETCFDNQLEWQRCYPFGTGMIIRRDIAIEYAARVNNDRYTLSDRKGKSLSSGGDVQLVFTAIEKGYCVGVIAGLELVHLIDASKANSAYMCRQQYGTASATIKSYNQVFDQRPILVEMVTNKQIFLRIYSLYRIYRRHMCKKDFQLMLASRLGELNAAVVATEQKKPTLLWLSEILLNV